MKTRITELFGCKYPIFQGGMAWIAEHTLASAVSNAGGLGIIAGGSAPIDYLRDQIRQTKATVNGKPFGVNIMLMSPNADDLAQLVIEEGVPVIALATQEDVYDKMISNIREVKAREAIVIGIGMKGDEELSKHVDHTIYVPRANKFIAPILAVVPLQLLAYYAAITRGADVDKPRNLAKSVTVE